MPITFNEDTNRFEGSNTFDQTLAGFDFSVFGGLVSNNGAIIAPVTANTADGIELVNTTFGTMSKAAGSQFAIDLLGNGGRLVVNDGYIFGSVRLGNGWDSFFNSGLIEGQVRTGNGNDTLTNQIIAGIDGGPDTTGTITGGVNMGDGDDTVLNTGVMANVALGAGNDTYTVGGFLIGDDDFFGAFDEDGGAGSAGNVAGGFGNDTMSGGAADDRLLGGDDDDRLVGNGGRDALYGQNGNDEVFGGNGNDFLSGGSGDDFIDGGNNNDRILGGDDNDVLFGGGGNDLLSGGNGNDRLLGQNGNDRMLGGAGIDTMEGGQGRDTLVGGEGADVFVFAGRTNADVIRDFSEGDQIELLLIGSNGSTTYDDIIANTVFTGSNAVIDLSAIFNLSNVDGRIDHGSTVKINGVTIDDLGASAFNIVDDIFIVG
ncbi:calcium-binding protein [Sulfitobacter sp.]|uniref:calcium-binding protein n=1 Tax=Sulfitobacter sp. TaxID=1903071 RepID=UPI003EF48510